MASGTNTATTIPSGGDILAPADAETLKSGGLLHKGTRSVDLFADVEAKIRRVGIFILNNDRWRLFGTFLCISNLCLLI